MVIILLTTPRNYGRKLVTLPSLGVQEKLPGDDLSLELSEGGIQRWLLSGYQDELGKSI